MKTIHLELEDDYRIIAISDVHGHREHLERLLKKCQIAKNDILIILGDFINRGKDSFETYEYVKKLSERDNTYILKGNHEYFIHTYLEDKDKIGRLHDFLKNEYYETIVGALLKDTVHTIHSLETDELYDYFMSHEALEFFKSLPIYMEVDNHVFVHGGYDEGFQEEGQFLKCDFFDEKSGINTKKIVVGHWPTSNLRYEEISNALYFNHEKNIISIDGGLGVKSTGELNALIIEKNRGKTSYERVFVHDFAPGRIIKAHEFPEEPLVYVNFPYYQFEFIEKGSHMSRCRHIHSGQSFSVFNELLYLEEGQYRLKTDYINRFLNLSVGDEILICEVFETCALVKYKETFGWILKKQYVKGE